MKNNSFIFLKEEKERIKKLYEATTAASSGAFEAPLTVDVAVEPIELEPMVVGGDNIAADSVEINLNIEDLEDMLGVTEEQDKTRMRKLHRDASLVKEQVEIPDIDPECLACVEEALGKYKDKATVVATKIQEIGLDGQVTVEEFGEAITTVLGQLGNLSMFDIIPIGQSLYGCKEKCASIVDEIPLPDIKI